MEKLFALMKIESVPMVDEDGNDVTIAYTDNLLKRNVVIEFYEFIAVEQPNIPGDAENESMETIVNAISCDVESSYSFSLFHGVDVDSPILVSRIIADAIEFIESCDPKTVIADLDDISKNIMISKDIKNANDRKKVYEKELWKFNTALELIQEKQRQKSL